jgi:glycosyltransferase involved in cell wall biosynthesis
MVVRRLPRRQPRPRVVIVRQVDLYEPMIQREADALVTAGFDVEVICMRRADRPRRVVINDVVVTSLPVSRKKTGKLRYMFDYARFFVLATALVTYRHLRRPLAVVQVNTMPDFLVFCAVVPKLMGCRVLAYMHEPSPELAETLYGTSRVVPLLARVEQRVLRFADHAIAVTDQLKARFVERGADPDRISVVLNGVDATVMRAHGARPPLAHGAGFSVVCIGTIEERYGYDTIVDAARLLVDDMPDLEVVFTGRGSHADELVRRIAQPELQGVVRFEGWVDPSRLNGILGAADAGVVAQKASSYSHLVHTNKMVDYWIFGLPVIASRLDATAAMYDDNVIEYFEPGDARSLADAIRHLRSDPARRLALARNGVAAQQRNGWDAQRATYLGVFDQLLDTASVDRVEPEPSTRSA